LAGRDKKQTCPESRRSYMAAINRRTRADSHIGSRMRRKRSDEIVNCIGSHDDGTFMYSSDRRNSADTVPDLWRRTIMGRNDQSPSYLISLQLSVSLYFSVSVFVSVPLCLFRPLSVTASPFSSSNTKSTNFSLLRH